MDKKNPQINQNIIKYPTQGNGKWSMSSKFQWILASTVVNVTLITWENMDILSSWILVRGHFRSFLMSADHCPVSNLAFLPGTCTLFSVVYLTYGGTFFPSVYEPWGSLFSFSNSAPQFVLSLLSLVGQMSLSMFLLLTILKSFSRPLAIFAPALSLTP